MVTDRIWALAWEKKSRLLQVQQDLKDGGKAWTIFIFTDPIHAQDMAELSNLRTPDPEGGQVVVSGATIEQWMETMFRAVHDKDFDLLKLDDSVTAPFTRIGAEFMAENGDERWLKYPEHTLRFVACNWVAIKLTGKHLGHLRTVPAFLSAELLALGDLPGMERKPGQFGMGNVSLSFQAPPDNENIYKVMPPEPGSTMYRTWRPGMETPLLSQRLDPDIHAFLKGKPHIYVWAKRTDRGLSMVTEYPAPEQPW